MATHFQQLGLQRARIMSLLATGGGLLFGGDVNARFRAYDQRTGRVLWEISLGSSVTGYPISYAVDGRQYVAVSTGTSNSGALMLNLTPELRPSSGNTIFVFALPNRDVDRATTSWTLSPNERAHSHRVRRRLTQR